MEPIIFTTEAAFIISGIGLVFLGTSQGKVILSGYRIRIIMDGKVMDREITGVDFHRGPNEKFGIVIKCESEEEKKELREWEIKGKQFDIFPS